MHLSYWQERENMRVVIFCDMEGVSCIETWEQVFAGNALYEECRKLYTTDTFWRAWDQFWYRR